MRHFSQILISRSMMAHIINDNWAKVMFILGINLAKCVLVMYAPNWDSTLESDVVQPKPVHTEPVHTDPAHTEPVRAEPIRSEPIHRGAPQAVLSQPPKTPTPPPVRNTQVSASLKDETHQARMCAYSPATCIF